MQGYTTRDRRRAHVREADEAADAVLAAGASTTQGGDASLGIPLKDTAAAAALFKQDSQFSMLVQAARLLLEQGRLAEAQTLLESCIRLFARLVLSPCRGYCHCCCTEPLCQSSDAAVSAQHSAGFQALWPKQTCDSGQ